jgi:tRNA threonylcarbamoyladenosine biosynthesis protein TsaE
MREIIMSSAGETKRFAGLLAEEMAGWKPDGARVVALVGELGAGKTAFAQGFAKALGIKEKVASPTFLILKEYMIQSATHHAQHKTSRIRRLIHIDCYRIHSPRELLHLGFGERVKDNRAVILIEWADRIRSLVPKDALWIWLEYGEGRNERVMTIQG